MLRAIFFLSMFYFCFMHNADADTIVCNTEYLGDNNVVKPGALRTWNTRHSYYCPQGIKDHVRLIFAGGFAANNPPQEYSLGESMTVGIEIDAPFPWQPGRTYNAGSVVAPPATRTNAGYNFIALRDTADFPSTLSKAWKAVAQVSVPLTCDHAAICVVPPGGFVQTDPLPINQPPRSNLVVRQHIINSSGIFGPTTPTTDGSYQTWGAGLPDLTRGGGYTSASAGAANMGPILIIGLQNNTTPVATVCTLGDSRAVGFDGVAVAYMLLHSGGTGYTEADVGKRLRNVDTNGTPRIGDSPIWRIMAVDAGGQVTALGMDSGGHFRPANDTVIDPTGIQPTTPIDPVHGTGVTVNIIAYSRSGSVFTDPLTRAQGFLSKGLADAGIPYFAVNRSGDAAIYWLKSNTQRLAAMRRSNCTDGVIQLGSNDINAGHASDAVIARLTEVATTLRAAQPSMHHVRMLTIPPTTYSAFWNVASYETPSKVTTARVAVNNWIIALGKPISKPYNVSSVLEVDKNNKLCFNCGLWRVADGTDGMPIADFWATHDSGHLAAGAQTAAAAYIASLGVGFVGH